MPWLITSYGLTAGRHLVETVLVLGHHRTGVVVAALGLATTIVGCRAAVQARRRSGSRGGSTS